MSRRLILAALLVITIIAMSQTTADAQFNINLRGIGIGSLICDGLVAGIQKDECPDGTCFVTCTLHQIAGECNCANPGGGIGGVSDNFSASSTAVASVGPITDTVAEGFGKEPFDVRITEIQLKSGLESAGVCKPPATPNDGWGIATEAAACPEDGVNSEPRNVCVLRSFIATVSVEDTDPAAIVTKNYQCTLDSSLTLADAPLCPSDFNRTPYKCSTVKLQ